MAAGHQPELRSAHNTCHNEQGHAQHMQMGDGGCQAAAPYRAEHGARPELMFRDGLFLSRVPAQRHKQRTPASMRENMGSTSGDILTQLNWSETPRRAR